MEHWARVGSPNPIRTRHISEKNRGGRPVDLFGGVTYGAVQSTLTRLGKELGFNCKLRNAFGLVLGADFCATAILPPGR